MCYFSFCFFSVLLVLLPLLLFGALLLDLLVILLSLRLALVLLLLSTLLLDITSLLLNVTTFNIHLHLLCLLRLGTMLRVLIFFGERSLRARVEGGGRSDGGMCCESWW